MSPSAAIHDPVFRAYIGIVAGVLIAAGILLALLQFVFKKQLGDIWKTYRSWLVMAALAALVIFGGRVPFILGVTVLAIFGFKEFARAAWLSPVPIAVCGGDAMLMRKPGMDGNG